jgi:hypothetical protein
MELNDFKEAWNRFAADSQGKSHLNEEEIRTMLSRRSKNLMERIDFNIRTGFIILLIILIPILAYDFSSVIINLNHSLNHVTTPLWLVIMDIGVNFLIISLLLIFLIHYFKVRGQCRNNCDLRHSLLKIINILTLYQRLFSLVLIIIMLESGTGFIAGFYTSVQTNHTAEGFLIPVLITGILLLFLLTFIIFLLLRWVFRRVYGNYLLKLRDTLKELDEL